MAPTENETAESHFTNAYTRPVLLTSQTATPAMAQVLALPELLREILNYLSFQDLFTSSRACGGFKDNIRDEKRLREKLKCEAYKWVHLEEIQTKEHPYYAYVPTVYEGRIAEEDLLLCPLLHAPGAPRYRLHLDVMKYPADPETWRPVYIISRPQFFEPEFEVELVFSVEASTGRFLQVVVCDGFDSAAGLTLGRLMDKLMGNAVMSISEGIIIDPQVGLEEWDCVSSNLADAIRGIEEETGTKAKLVEGKCLLTFD